jgi:hypothetical protein
MARKADDSVTGVVLRSEDDRHRCKIFVRSDGRLAVVKLKRDESGNWTVPAGNQGEVVLAPWTAGVNW